MALIAAWKASLRESCAGFFSVLDFGVGDFGRRWSDGPLFSGDLFGSDGVDGSVFDSTVSNHGFVFEVVMYACRFDVAEGIRSVAAIRIRYAHPRAARRVRQAKHIQNDEQMSRYS